MTKKFKRNIYDILPCLKVTHKSGYVYMGIKQYHYDPDLIIDYFKKARGDIVIQGGVYKLCDGDIVVLSPDKLHFCQLEEEQQGERITLHINKGLLYGFDCNADEFFKVFYGNRNIIPAGIVKEFGLDVIIENIVELAQSENNNIKILARCKAIELVNVIDKATKVYESKQYDSIENPRLKEILYYINHNFTEDITLTSISEKFFYSKYHICMLFKKYIGISLTDYVIIRRIHYVNDLISKGTPIAQASVMAGFNNYSNFYRLYKKHMKITPLEYKQKDAQPNLEA